LAGKSKQEKNLSETSRNNTRKFSNNTSTFLKLLFNNTDLQAVKSASLDFYTSDCSFGPKSLSKGLD